MNIHGRIERLEKALREKEIVYRWVRITRDDDASDDEAIRRAGHDPDDSVLRFIIRQII